MVWFQCEDCGENLKKPKVPNHFRMCSATKLSCIDCGEMFGQESVQSHTQCITEAEKYGPKGQGKASNGTHTKPNKDANKQKLDIDITAGLSERAPWFCSLCNTKATSRQTLLLHAEGKKHRAKARAFHAAKQPAKQTEESAVNSKVSTENVLKGDLVDNGVEKSIAQDLAKVDVVHPKSETDNGDFSSNKKRKANACENNGAKKMIKSDTSGGNREMIQVERTEAENTESQGKKATRNVVKEDKVLDSSYTKDESKKKIKWKKLIKSALKSSPDGVLQMKKLKKLVLKSLQESGITEDETKLVNILEHKIKSSSRFTHDNKHVHLAAKD